MVCSPSGIFRVTLAAMTCSLAALRTAWRVAVKLRATGLFWMRTGAPMRADMVMAIAAKGLEIGRTRAGRGSVTGVRNENDKHQLACHKLPQDEGLQCRVYITTSHNNDMAAPMMAEDNLDQTPNDDQPRHHSHCPHHSAECCAML